MKIHTQKIEIIILLLATVLLFSVSKVSIPSIFMAIFFAVSSMYFFPGKLLFSKYEKQTIVSDVLISMSLGVAVIGFYTDYKLILSVVGVLNFLFILFYIFYNQRKNTKAQPSRLLIVTHYLAMLILIIAT